MKAVIVLLVLISFTPLLLQASGQQNLTDADLWIPDIMLEGNEYYGMIRIDKMQNEDVTFEIITDNDSIFEIITRQVTIDAGKHQAIVNIYAKDTGSADVYAIHKDILLTENSMVEISASVPTKIQLVLPENIFDILDENNRFEGYVFLLNEFDDPIQASVPVSVVLTRNGDIELVQTKVTIPTGEHYVKFPFNIRSFGTISATSPNMEPSSATVSLKQDDEISVKLGIAPEPTPTSSDFQIYYWLERDGKPYIAEHDVSLMFSFDDAFVASFNAAVRGSYVISEKNIGDENRRVQEATGKDIITRTNAQLLQDSTANVTLLKGSHYGKIQGYTAFLPGSVEITVFAESQNPDKKDDIIRSSETIDFSTVMTAGTIGKLTGDPSDDLTNPIATKTHVVAFPDPAFDLVEITVSGTDGGRPVMEQNQNKFNIFVDGGLRSVGSTGIIEVDQNYKTIPLQATTIGNSTVIVQLEQASSDEIDINLSEKSIKESDLVITKLPIIYGLEQDLFLVTIAEKEVSDDSSDTEMPFLSITTKPTYPFEISNQNESVLTVRGTISVSDETPTVYLSSNAFTNTDELDVFNSNRKSIIVMLPEKTYPNELFPIMIHIGDVNSNPLYMAKPRISSEVELLNSGELYMINKTGNHEIIFFDENITPVESQINVEGPQKTVQNVSSEEIRKRSITMYTLEVENGSGSGEYPEDAEVTISAEPVIQDGLTRKVFVQWEDLGFTEPTTTFEIDDDITTKAIYREDNIILYGIVAAAIGGGIAIVYKVKFAKKSNKPKSKMSDEEKFLDELEDI